jgi:hypothetical protein
MGILISKFQKELPNYWTSTTLKNPQKPAKEALLFSLRPAKAGLRSSNKKFKQ